jgi:cytoskeletal protein RodZ
MTTGIGETLREARHRRGLTLDEAAEETRIRATNLAELEQDHFDRLGGEVYVRGFIRSYAKCLGIDPEPLLQQHRPAETPSLAEAPMPASRQPLERGPRRGLGVMLALLALLAIIGLAMLGDSESDTSVGLNDDSVSDPGGSIDDTASPGQASPSPTPTMTATPSPEATAADSERDSPRQGVSVELETVEREVWVRARVDGDEVLAAIVPPDSTKTFQSRGPIQLRLGDAGAVRLTVNGQAQGSLGASGQPVSVTIGVDGNVTLG